MLGAVQKALGEMQIDWPNEMQAFLDQLIGKRMEDVTQILGGAPHGTLDTQADGMFFEAMEARTMFATKRKLAAVLKLDPDHVRALTALAMMESNPQKKETATKGCYCCG
jgi:thioredoxin-like negative regulator of GroEL